MRRQGSILARAPKQVSEWIPAFAGTTRVGCRRCMKYRSGCTRHGSGVRPILQCVVPAKAGIHSCSCTQASFEINSCLLRNDKGGVPVLYEVSEWLYEAWEWCTTDSPICRPCEGRDPFLHEDRFKHNLTHGRSRAGIRFIF